MFHHLLNGGGERDRTDDLLNANQALSQLSYTPIIVCLSDLMVGLERLELSTSRLSSARSNQLSYKPLKSQDPVQNKEKRYEDSGVLGSITSQIT